MRDPYLYAGTDVLTNKLGIKEQQLLDEAEAAYVSMRLREIAFSPLDGSYDFEHFCSVHQYIFQDIFSWAGQPRIINIEKPEAVLGGLSIEYAEFQDITAVASSAISKMKHTEWHTMSIDQQGERFSDCIAELWRVHSFREGNTRTVIHFCAQFAEKAGMPLDRVLFEQHSDYFRNALVAAAAVFRDLGDKRRTEYLVKIVTDALRLGREKKRVEMPFTDLMAQAKAEADRRNGERDTGRTDRATPPERREER